MVPLWTRWGDRPVVRTMGCQFGEITYISEVNGAVKVKSDAQLAQV